MAFRICIDDAAIGKNNLRMVIFSGQVQRESYNYLETSNIIGSESVLAGEVEKAA